MVVVVVLYKSWLVGVNLIVALLFSFVIVYPVPLDTAVLLVDENAVRFLLVTSNVPLTSLSEPSDNFAFALPVTSIELFAIVSL